MTLDLASIIAGLYGKLEEMENAICEQEERLRDITAEVVAWRASEDMLQKEIGAEPGELTAWRKQHDSAYAMARRLRKVNEELYP
jgi:septal ring factor EnvC (AmiA/AmiB activator)